MASLATIWGRATANRKVSLPGCLAFVALGVLIIAVGEVQDWGWTRIVGATVISIGSIAAGALIGWSDPVRPRITYLISSWGKAIVAILTLIIVGPMLIALVVAFGGLIVGGAEADTGLMLIGVLIAVLLLGITLVTVASAFSLAMRGLWRSRPDEAGETNGRHSA